MRRRQPGFTLVELLVVIAIICVLVALLLPAVQSARESARRLQCQNNMRQWGLGLQTFHDVNDRFPYGGYGAWANPELINHPVAGSAYNDPRTAMGWENGSWILWTLPFVEQQIIFDNFRQVADSLALGQSPVAFWLNSNPERKPPLLDFGRCPSDGIGSEDPYFNYSGSTGPTCRAGSCGFLPNDQFCDGTLIGLGYERTFVDHGHPSSGYVLHGMFSRIAPVEVNIKQVTDGTTNTLLLGEKKVNCEYHLSDLHQEVAWWWAGNNAGYAHISTIVPINYPILCEATTENCGSDSQVPEQAHPGNYNISSGIASYHPGGANVVLVDASVQFLSEDIDQITLQKLGHKSDGFPVDLSEL